ncbi:MAG: hypothetical protein J6D29_01760 [Solobacterium sp.]|nr:hypothetical protein [Solobacterium sp.]
MNIKRILMSLIGVVITAISVGLFKLAAFGVDPFQAFMAGLDQLIPIDFGTLYMLANAVLLLFALVFDRHYIGIATFINLFLLGYITDFSYRFFQSVFVSPSFLVRIVCLLVGIVVLTFGASLYITADLGVSTYDAIALIIAHTWKKGEFQYVRIGSDFVCVLLGILLFLVGKGDIKNVPTFVGIGTIITAFFMGPLIEFFAAHIARPLLKKEA